MSNAGIPEDLSAKVLLVGEYFNDSAHGGIAAVLRYYRPYFPKFRFVASHRSSKFSDKLRYDLGGLFKMSAILLWNRISGGDMRLVHIHTAAGGSFRNHQYYVHAAKLLGYKVVLHSHASSFEGWFASSTERGRRSILKTLNGVDRLVVLSESWKRWFIGIGVSDMGGRITVLNNIAEPPAEPFVKPVRGNAPRELLFLGEIGPRKGLFDVVDSIAEHRSGLAGKMVLRVGGNRNVRQLLDAIEDKNLSGLVEYEGFVSGEKKRELLRNADALILTSYNEGLPISILEAMSYGDAVISTPVGGIPEVVDATNGILVAPGDRNAIYDAVLRIVSMPEDELRAMGAAGRKKAEPFWPEHVMNSLAAIYSSVIQGEKED